MKKMILTSVAVVLVAALPISSPGTMPVIDYSNLTQNITTALHQVSAYAQQVQQYQLQLQQYANQVRNTAAPVAQVWQQAQQAMNGDGHRGDVSEWECASELSEPVPKCELLAKRAARKLYLSDCWLCRAKAG